MSRRQRAPNKRCALNNKVRLITRFYGTVVDILVNCIFPRCVQYITLKIHSDNNFMHTFVDCEDLVIGGIHLLHWKTVVDAFWNAELEDEL